MAKSARAHDPGRASRLLTVGIPVFNGKALLRECLDSVLASTLPRDRYEIVIADDGSTDPETLAILAELEERLAAEPGFCRVLRTKVNSGGAARPRNRILAAATGEYVFFVDADDRIGDQALERIADALETAPADWVALHQVPVNGRAGHAVVKRPRVEVTRAQALSTLTVHKVFRRAEIERQRLRFDERLPSGQDVRFAFSFLVNAERFLMLGGYEYYYLVHHKGDPAEPMHLSQRSRTAKARIQKNERILGAMLDALRKSSLPVEEQRRIVAEVCLPRIVVREGYLSSIVKVGPAAGPRALRRLSRLLATPLVTGLDPAELKRLDADHLAAITSADWNRLAELVGPVGSVPPPRLQQVVTRGLAQGRRVFDTASGRTRHRRLVRELAQLRRSVEEVRAAQLRIEAALQPSPPPVTVPARHAPESVTTPGGQPG
jgi:hypothetical protein